MKMRKEIVVVGVILLVVGALLAIYGFFSPPRETIIDDTDTIPAGYYYYFWFEVPFGMSVHTEYTTSDEVEFVVLDSHNFELFEAEEDYDAIYDSWGKSQSHTFHAPKDDTYYIALCNVEDHAVSVSVEISRDVSWARFIWLGGIGLSVMGLISLVVGLILKPKMRAVTRICPQCGRVIPPDVKLCPYCGKTVELAETQET